MSNTDSYLTLAQSSEGIYKEKGSKFLAFAYPVSEEVEIKEKLEALKKKYHDARHYCYAYILGFKQEKYRANDDGEPNNSAGIPILNQLRSKNLTNILVVVVRYFGGIKLGVGGLVNAYKTAASEALQNAQIIEKQIKILCEIRFQYHQTNEIMKLIKEFDLEIREQKNENVCSIKVLIRQKEVENLQKRLQFLSGLSFQIF